MGHYIAEIDATLHTHHESEDELLWDRLEKRAPGCALHVGQMRAHHAEVSRLLAKAAPLLTAWRASADPKYGAELADAYEELLSVLKVHLRREVVEVVPVAEKVITAEEWKHLGDHSMDAIPKSRLLVQLGMMLAASPGESRQMFDELPMPIRFMYRLVGRRQFERQFRELFPGRPVPRRSVSAGTGARAGEAWALIVTVSAVLDTQHDI
ncbi:hemerythrin domain-containing protein [Tessaracoccus sp. HDW20]|uniref:hemerythrin domain-containing protein n=1 Tax=Tessaracoccus coleopterorum TaxID=2714950 RepID=UPI0018D4D8F2|nr:hemerythrin domain-containing protein [Tessaracoccus coleopterorum]